MLKTYLQKNCIEFVLLLLIIIIWLHCKLCILYLCTTQSTFIITQYSNNASIYLFHHYKYQCIVITLIVIAFFAARCLCQV